MDNKELIALGRTDATTPLVVQNHVFDPLVFAPTFVRFSRKQYLFLNAYRLGVPLSEAAEKAEMTPESAERFLDKKDVRAWLEDRAKMDYIKREWEEPAKWWHEGNEVWEGRKACSKPQILVWQEFGARICPKKVEGGAGNGKVVININPGAVKEAFARQEAIEGELSQ